MQKAATHAGCKELGAGPQSEQSLYKLERGPRKVFGRKATVQKVLQWAAPRLLR